MDVALTLRRALQDRYRLERELGQGGMATVYLAEDLKHHRQVALKVLRPELAAVLGSERFLREIELAARLTHPHILPVHDSGAAGGFLYYVMPYVEGESLRDWLLREKQLPLDDALQVAREVADALSYAHSHGVIHRDIKPENILLESGHAVVADFGIARAVDQAGGERLTETGVAVGTPAYMSPEQAAGSKDLDGRSDLYALGCVLYEMLAGQPPFTGPTAESVVHQHLAATPPSITGIRPAVPAGVAAAIQRALAKTPADRFNPVALFAEALGGRISATGAPAAPGLAAAVPTAPAPTVAAPARRSWQRIAAAAAAVVLVIAGAVAVGRWLLPMLGDARHPRTAIAVLPLENLSAQGPYAYFAGGLHDELLTQLAKVVALRVIGRTSVRGYEGTSKRLSEIGDELAVGSIVEGSVQVVGDRLRVNVQLIDPVTETHVWAETYDRTLDDAFAVQSDIAQRIVTAVGATLTSAEAGAIAATPTTNAEAYRLYLQAEEYRRRPGYDSANFGVAQRLLERALTLDSGFAVAHASLSHVEGVFYFLFGNRPERRERQRLEAETALRLAPNLPQAHFAMGLSLYWGRLDYPAALEEFGVAVRGQPNDAEFWSFVGYASAAAGRWADWEAALRRATQLNPRDANLFYDLGGNQLQFHRRYSEAVAAYSRAMDLAPDMADYRLGRAFAFLLWQGHLDSLRATLASESAHFPSMGEALLWRTRLALWERRPERVLELLPQPGPVTLEAQDSWEPGLLYAARAQRLRGDAAAARGSFAGALRQLDSALLVLPADQRLHASRGLALAGLGRSAEARREADWLGAKAVAAGAQWGDIPRSQRAAVLAQAGFADDAIAALDQILAGPSWYISVPLLRLDPIWDPIRRDPRFQTLLVKYATPEAR